MPIRHTTPGLLRVLAIPLAYLAFPADGPEASRRAPDAAPSAGLTPQALEHAAPTLNRSVMDLLANAHR